MDESHWHLVAEERRSLVRMLQGLSPAQWQTQSLCEEWTIHQVVAHLAMTPARDPSLWGLVTAIGKARGRLFTAGRDIAVDYAASHDPLQLVSMLRDLAEARSKPLFVLPVNILPDLVVHGQDIAVPLGIDRRVPDAAARIALDRTWTMGWPFHPQRRLAGVRLVAQGHQGPIWEAGEGPQVRGSSGDVALLMTGRTATALDRLAGPGLGQLNARLTGMS